MTTDRDVDTSRTAVKTYVPAYQKRRWAAHADELGMSQSEFVRSMVQAGRRGFSPPDDPGSDPGAASDAEGSTGDSGSEGAEEEPVSSDATPGVRAGETGSSETPSNDDGPDLADRVLEVLDREGVLSWDELLEAVTDDIERQLDEAVQELQDENAIRYSGREGGYTLRS